MLCSESTQRPSPSWLQTHHNNNTDTTISTTTTMRIIVKMKMVRPVLLMTRTIVHVRSCTVHQALLYTAESIARLKALLRWLLGSPESVLELCAAQRAHDLFLSIYASRPCVQSCATQLHATLTEVTQRSSIGPAEQACTCIACLPKQ